MFLHYEHYSINLGYQNEIEQRVPRLHAAQGRAPGYAGSEPAVQLRYGAFVQSIVDFLIVAFAIFLLIKQVNRFRMTDLIKDKDAPKEPKLTADQKLLTEIRDLLAKQAA